MNLRQTESDLQPRDINLVKPEKPKKPPVSWGKIVYLTILGIIALFLLYYLFNRIFFVRGQGVFTAEVTDIASVSPARIEKIVVEPNTYVQVGDTLALIYETSAYSTAADTTIRFTDIRRTDIGRQNRDRQKAIELQRQHQLLSLELQSRERTRADIDGQLRLAQNLFDEEAITRREFQVVKNQYDDAVYKVEETNRKLRYNWMLLQSLDLAPEDNPDPMIATGRGWARRQVLIAPHEGLVTRVLKRDYEAVRHADPIMKLVDTRKFYVRAFFKFAHRDYLEPGKKVKLYFADGSKYVGILSNIHKDSEFLLEEFRREFSMREKYIVADILIVPDVKIEPGSFMNVARDMRMTPEDVYNDMVKSGYVDKQGYVTNIFNPLTDPGLSRLAQSYRPQVPAIRDVFLKMYRELNRHILGTSVSVVFPKWPLKRSDQ